MDIRNGQNEKDFYNSKKIWKDVFTDSEDYIDYYFNKRYFCENYLLVERENEFLGGLFNNPYNFSLNGEVKKSWYIVGVATKLEHRGIGVMNKLLFTTINYAWLSGFREIFLKPIDPSLYTKYGFVFTHNLYKYTHNFKLLLSNLNIERDTLNKYKITEINKKSDLTTIPSFYNESLKDLSSYIYKEKEDILNFLEECHIENGSGYLVEKNNVIVGLFFLVKENSNIHLKELIFNEKEVLDKILHFTTGYSNYYENLTITTSNNLVNSFKNSNYLEILQLPSYMTRITNPKLVLQSYYEKFKRDKDLYSENIKKEIFSITFNIHDSCVNSNNITYSHSERVLEDQIINLDISDLTLLAYSHDISAVTNKIKNKKVSILLEILFKKNKNYINLDV